MRYRQALVPDDIAALEPIIEVLGGKTAWRIRPRTQLEVHEAIEKGIGWRVFHSTCLKYPQVEKDIWCHTIGISLRTLQRKEKEPDSLLTVDQGARLWKFGEVLAKALEVLGSREEAINWLKTPAIGLNQRAPITLLTTTAGAEMVETLLQRMEYGVYS